MDGFRIICDLSEILQGIMKRSFLYVDEKYLTISGLCSRIKTVFNISTDITLTINGVFLPYGENIKILRPDDVVRVVPFQSGLTQWLDFTIENEITCKAQERANRKGDDVSIENSSVYSKKPRKGVKRSTILCDESTQLPTEERTVESGSLNELIDEVPTQNGASPTEEKKSKRLKKRKCINTEDESLVLLGSTDIIPEIVPCGAGVQELAIGESTEVFPANETDSPKKRKRIRIRKRKTNPSDITLSPCNQQYYNGYESAPKPYTPSYLSNKNAVSNFSHVRFSLDVDHMENEPLNETVPENSYQKVSVQVDNPVGEIGCGMNVTKINEPIKLTSGNSTPLVVRRTSIGDAKSAAAARVRTTLKKQPEKDDIISFKIWKMDQSYCPQISGVIQAKVLEYCQDSQQVKFFVIDGKSNLETPRGKFSLEMDTDEDSPLPLPVIPDIMELNWQEMLETEFFL